MRDAAKVVAAIVVVVGVWTSWFGASRGDGRRAAELAGAGAHAEARGTALVEVPPLVGFHDSFARHLLELTRLRPGRVRLEPSSRPWGSVIFQSIAPGSPVPPGTKVDLVLAKGSVPEPCRVYWCATASGDVGGISRS